MAYGEEEELTAEIQALPAPRYRRPYYINEPAKPNTCYYIDQLEVIRSALFKFGGNALVDRFREGPFGHFLGWNPKKSYGGVLNSILSRAIYSRRGIWFNIGGQDIEYSHHDHALITGLKFGPTTFDPCRRRNPRHSRTWQVVCAGANDSANRLLELLNQNPSPFDDPDGDIHLRLANMLIVNNCLLGHDARKPPYSWLWFLADDMHTFIEFPWGAYTLKTLRYYVRTLGGTETKYHFRGPAWALIVWGFEIIRGLGPVGGMLVAGHLYPRFLRWHYRVSLRRTTDEELYALFDDIQYELQNLIPEPRELETVWYRSVDVEGSYSVSFCEPVNAVEATPEITNEALDRSQLPFPMPDAGTASGSRPRRSARNRVPEHVSDHGVSTSRPHRESRDTGKRVRASSSTSSGGHRRDSSCTHEQFNAIVEEVVGKHTKNIMEKMEADKKEVKAEIRATENRLLAFMKDLFGCSSSRRSPQVFEPRRRSPPIVSSARDSGVDVLEPRSTGHVETVGLRTDTSLPIFTHDATTSGYAESGTAAERFVTSIFGETAPVATAPSSSYIPSYGVPYEPPLSYAFEPPRHSMLEFSTSTPEFLTPTLGFSTPSVPFVTTRQPARKSASSVDIGQSSNSTKKNKPKKAKNTLLRPVFPARPPDDVVSHYKIFMRNDDDTAMAVVEATDLVSVGDFKLMCKEGVDWDPLMFNLAMMTFRTRLRSGVQVYPQFGNGRTIVCNLDVMVELKAEFETLKSRAIKDFASTTQAEIEHVVTTMFVPGPQLIKIAQGQEIPYQIPSWWKADKVFVPWIVKDERYIFVIIDLRSKRLIVQDPLDRGAETLDHMRPLITMVPIWVESTMYWRMNELGLGIEDNMWQVSFYPVAGLIKYPQLRCSGPVACMNLERTISGCPALEMRAADVTNYRLITAQRIYGHARA